jgi:hypothetical protein
MKIHLEFSADQERLAMRSIQGDDAFCVLYTINETLRSFLKHGNDNFKTPEQLAAHIREEICEFLVKAGE